jgi:hypothetical protein
MGTTIEDVLQEQVEEDNYRKKEVERIISYRKGNLIAEQAIEIHDFLPMARSDAENNYILYLWDAYITLDTLGETGRGFSIMPFHILFMLALQYKILRISKIFSKECNLVFSIIGNRNRDLLINPNKSVFDLALLPERTLPELFKLINLGGDAITQIKDLVDYRNDNLAHPKGGIEADPERKIIQYIELLKSIQLCMSSLNSDVAKKWIAEMGSGKAGEEYIQLHLAEEFLCIADMQQGAFIELEKRLKE